MSNLVPAINTSTEADPTPNFDLISIVCVDSIAQNSGDVGRTATFNLQVPPSKG